MSLRKMFLVCVVALMTVLPLVGCNGNDAGSGGGDTSNTTSQ